LADALTDGAEQICRLMERDSFFRFKQTAPFKEIQCQLAVRTNLSLNHLPSHSILPALNAAKETELQCLVEKPSAPDKMNV